MITKTIELRDSVKEVMRGALLNPVFYQRADKDATYPYYVFNMKRISSENGIDKYVLEVDAWDQHPTSSRIEVGMDMLESKIHAVKQMDSSRMLIVYKGQRDPVDDEDKSIKRIREQFEMHVCERR